TTTTLRVMTSCTVRFILVSPRRDVFAASPRYERVPRARRAGGPAGPSLRAQASVGRKSRGPLGRAGRPGRSSGRGRGRTRYARWCDAGRYARWCDAAPGQAHRGRPRPFLRAVAPVGPATTGRARDGEHEREIRRARRAGPRGTLKEFIALGLS